MAFPVPVYVIASIKAFGLNPHSKSTKLQFNQKNSFNKYRVGSFIFMKGVMFCD